MTALERTAIHEAAHATIALRLGIALGVVSIRPTASYRGICGLSGRMTGVTAFDPARPLLAQPVRPRRLLESRMRVSLAGPAADRLWWRESGYQPGPATPRRVALPPAAAAMLHEIERDEEPRVSDEDDAADLAYVLVGRELSVAYHAFAIAETSAMVAADSRVIERLAAELLVHTAMSSRQVRAVVRGDRKA